eukprot:scaffold62032_cov57-Phaeocystis_antarctica.AAC.2
MGERERGVGRLSDVPAASPPHPSQAARSGAPSLELIRERSQWDRVRALCHNVRAVAVTESAREMVTTEERLHYSRQVSALFFLPPDFLTSAFLLEGRHHA